MPDGKLQCRRAALVLEDNGLIAMSTREMLLECGFASVVVAATGTDALHALGEGRVDFALLDATRLPDGAAAVAQVLEDAGVPFAFVCDDAGGGDLGFRWGARPYLVRPYVKGDIAALFGPDGEARTGTIAPSRRDGPHTGSVSAS